MEVLKLEAEAIYARKCQESKFTDFIPATRLLGTCKKCKRELIEYCNPWCYNHGMGEKHEIR